jgi:hypothetical protein
MIEAWAAKDLAELAAHASIIHNLQEGMTMESLTASYIMPLGIVGLPVTEDRARELARIVAGNLSNTDAIAALVELLLGIAPQENTELHEYLSQRRPIAKLEAGDLEALSVDLWTRYAALAEAVAVLYTFTPEFRETLEQYAWRVRQESKPQKGRLDHEKV